MSELSKGKSIVDQWFTDTMAGKFNDVTGHSSHEWEALEKRIDEALATLTLRWTDEKPTKPGWYWWRNGSDHIAIMMRVQKGFALMTATRFISNSTVTEAVIDLGGQWSSQPIMAPEEQAMIARR